MPLKIVRNDITKMHTEAIVNTANDKPTVGTGCDHAVYEAAGYDRLLDYRKEHIGVVEEGEVFLTPGFGLTAKYIIHAVSPLYIDGKSKEEAAEERSAAWESMDLSGHVSYYEERGLSRKEAMKAVSKDRGISRRDVYQELLKEKQT